jgi:4-amino-4-deoxy-L-arabinose transferase-like glycosyltransferase
MAQLIEGSTLSTDTASGAAGSAPNSDKLSRRLESFLFPAAAAAMVIFIFAGIHRSIWLDEANSISIACGDFSSIFARLKIDNNFPIYYVVLHFWARLFGESELALRLLSGISYALATAAVYLGGASLFRDKRAALYAAFFYLVSTQAVHQAQNIRMYALLGLLSAASTVLFCEIFAEGAVPKRKWFWYAVVNSIGMLTHLWFAFVLLGQGAAILLWQPKRLRSFVAAGFAAAVPFLMLWSPALWAQINNGATRWMPGFKPIFILHAVMDYYGGPAALAFYAGCAVLIFYHPRQKLVGGTKTRLLATCFVVSLALPLAISAFKPIFWPGRYTIIGLAPLALWLGWTLARSASKPVLAIFCYATLAIVVTAHLWSRDVNPESGVPETKSDKAAAQFLLQLAKPGDAVVFTSLSRPAIDYYLRRAGAGSRFLEFGFPSENSVHLGWGDLTLDDRRLPKLQAEAESTVTSLTGLAPAARIFVLYGAGLPVGAILRDELDRRLRLQREIPVTGPYFTTVLEYSRDR